ncbi:MAG: cytochrome P450 [Streptosporangiales bacterium]|nr:cytochrome P450 [Streptosporangiales bacterium]
MTKNHIVRLGPVAATRVWGAMVRDPLRTYGRIARAYGDTVEIGIAPRRSFFLFARPEHAERVLVSGQHNYVKAFTYRPLASFLRTGLVTSEGETWQRHRRMVQPVFSARHVAGFAPAIGAGARRTAERWRALGPDASVDIASEMATLTLDVVGRALFGVPLGADTERLSGSLGTLQSAAVAGAFVPMLWGPRTVGVLRRVAPPVRRAVDGLDGVVYRLIEAHRADLDPENPRDLLDLMLTARDADGAGLSDEELRDEVATFVLAGHETTSLALTWAFVLLSENPGAWERLAAEARALTGDELTAADLDRLPWTAAVVSEAIRLYPPAWTIERDATADDEVAGVPVPKGSIVAIPPYLIHRHPDFWPNPEGFAPERFLDGDAGRHRYAYLPFGGGRRGCVGASFARLEAVLLLAALAREFRPELRPGVRPAARGMVTLRPRGPVPMTIRKL